MTRFFLRDIREVWPQVRPGLEAILARGGDWRPEDVYAACRYGHASLFLAATGAFCVVQSARNDYSNEQELLLWAGYNPDPGGMEPYMEQLAEIARGFGAARLRMWSTREGWERAPGWARGMTEYTYEVADGRLAEDTGTDG